jgi:hypothetical protein
MEGIPVAGEMNVKVKYRGMVSSDWNECLAPCGPFDPVSFAYPELQAELARVFLSYTSNQISLSEASRRLGELLSQPVSEKQMDAYLEASFVTYRGVTNLIRHCLDKGILFMINTTGMQGYFQRALARSLLPPGIVIAANPTISFQGHEGNMYEVREIEDKAMNTAAVLREHSIPAGKLIIMGDSGGDGPHFEWGESVGAYLVGSMTKPSLEKYCRERGIRISTRFGVSYGDGEKKNQAREMEVDFMGFVPIIEEVVERT